MRNRERGCVVEGRKEGERRRKRLGRREGKGESFRVGEGVRERCGAIWFIFVQACMYLVECIFAHALLCECVCTCPCMNGSLMQTSECV